MHIHILFMFLWLTINSNLFSEKKKMKNLNNQIEKSSNEEFICIILFYTVK